jgi:hypothetical protein
MTRCFWCALCGVLLAAPAADARNVSLQAAAGLGGVAKPARWVPVRIDIDNHGDAVATELVLQWGDVTVRRRLSLAASSRRDVEVYLRSAEPTGQMRVYLESEPDNVVDVPVRVVASNQRVTLCVATADTVVPDASRCSVTLPPEQLPASTRGYDAADDIVSALPERLLPVSRRVAIAQAHALRELDLAGDLALTSQVTRPAIPRGLPVASSRMIAVIAATYVVLLIGLGIVAAWAAPSMIWATAAVVILAATAAALAVGRIGPSSLIHIHHSALIQQLPNVPGALLTIRGVAQFPSPGSFEVRLDAHDAMLETVAGSGNAQQSSDEDGRPVLAGRFGLGARQAFFAEGVVDAQLLSVVEVDKVTIRVTNRSSQTLHRCGFAFGFSVGEFGSLDPGQSAIAVHAGDVVGPVFTCTMEPSPVTFTAGPHGIALSGETMIAAYLPRVARAAEVTND